MIANSSNNCNCNVAKGWKFDNPPTADSFEFERLDIEYIDSLLNKYWHLCFYIGAMYILAIFGLQLWMKNRRAFDLRLPLFIWNATLSIFSIVALYRTLPTLIHVLNRPNGLYISVCLREGLNHVNTFWGLLFTVSKTWELGDTVFIVLRKRKLVFLQWYHHLITMIVTWTVAPLYEPIARWYSAINCAVHAIMYPYFALKTIGIHVPRSVAKTITTLQFLQMVVGFTINIITLHLKRNGYGCVRESYSVMAFSIVYGSFTLLFAQILFKSISPKTLGEKTD